MVNTWDLVRAYEVVDDMPMHWSFSLLGEA